ncbi:MAG: tRNA lysidine(34) synthetase TilS [Clostridia bacterium]|nr:tRNA lysidine(34) synthetase TilS [Clostridia bacterium]
MKQILSLTRAAVDRYNMIEDGDRIAVGVSGGKDSLVLLTALARLRTFYPKRFDITAVTLDYNFNGEKGNYDEIKRLCEELKVDYVIKSTRLWEVIFVERKEKNPCSLCAKMRRGILHDAAKEAGCNKVALGHHLDDAAETFMMNLLSGGRVACFSPVSYLSEKKLYLIRPMVLIEEREIEKSARRNKLPVVKSKCPADKVTNRQRTKELLASLEKEYPMLRQKIIGAMQSDNVSGWGEMTGGKNLEI